jgi:hypothetical protein
MSKFTVYCKIIDFIEAKGGDHKEFADVIRGTCNDNVLGSTRNKLGITFLYPDKKYREKIIDKAYSSDIKEAQEANDMIQSLILNNVFRSGDRMMEDKELSNCMRTPQVIEIDKATSDTVTFKSGAVAKFDPTFKSTNERLAVWNLTGEIPTKTRDAVRRQIQKGAKMPKNGKKGSYEYDNTLSQTMRWKIMRTIENIYLTHEHQKVLVGLECDIYLSYTLSLLKHLKETDEEAFDKLMPKISLDKSDLYFMIQPHLADSNYIIRDEVLKAWWEKCSDYRKLDLHTARKIIYGWLDATKSDREKIAKRVDRRAVESSLYMADEIKKQYEQLRSLTIGGEPFITEHKMVEDEARFICADLFERFEKDNCNNKKVDNARFEFITNYIGDLLRGNSNQLINTKKVLETIRPIEKINAMKTFVGGSWFCYVPMTKGEFGKIGFRPEREGDIIDMNIPEVSLDNSSHLRRMTRDEIMDMIRSQSEEFKEHLRKELL